MGKMTRGCRALVRCLAERSPDAASELASALGEVASKKVEWTRLEDGSYEAHWCWLRLFVREAREEACGEWALVLGLASRLSLADGMGRWLPGECYGTEPTIELAKKRAVRVALALTEPL
jgi:hypothetical protein